MWIQTKSNLLFVFSISNNLYNPLLLLLIKLSPELGTRHLLIFIFMCVSITGQISAYLQSLDKSAGTFGLDVRFVLPALSFDVLRLQLLSEYRLTVIKMKHTVFSCLSLARVRVLFLCLAVRLWIRCRSETPWWKWTLLNRLLSWDWLIF